MTKQQIQIELKNEYLALAFCQNASQTKMVEARIHELKQRLVGA